MAYYEATGRDRFLNCMCRAADFVDDYFRVRQAAPFLTPGHEEIELALVRLYQTTGSRKYLELAGWFLKTRGTNALDQPVGPDYSRNYQQDNAPVWELKEATGHAVRACYLYTAMADYARETDDAASLATAEAVFMDITTRKMYVTGGVGSSKEGEAFTIPYDLPNETAYAETCAAIALFFFAHRLLLATNDGKYADIMETCLYNGLASGLSRSGDEFFYVNPLRLDKKSEERYTMLVSGFPERPLRHRVKMFRCSCCPPNLTRLFASAGGYVFGEDADTVFVNLLESARFTDGERRVEVAVQGRYGEEIILRSFGVKRLAVRIPSWLTLSSGRFEASEPYEEIRGFAVFTAPAGSGGAFEVTIRLNGLRPVALFSDPRVTENTGKIAFRFGATVYCMEACDNPDVLSLLADESRFDEIRTERNEAEDRTELLVPGLHPRYPADHTLYGSFMTEAAYEPVMLRLIPYRDFANREDADMTIWIPCVNLNM